MNVIKTDARRPAGKCMLVIPPQDNGNHDETQDAEYAPDHFWERAQHVRRLCYISSLSVDADCHCKLQISGTMIIMDAMFIRLQETLDSSCSGRGRGTSLLGLKVCKCS